MSHEADNSDMAAREHVTDLELLVIELADFSAYENSAHAHALTIAKIRAVRENRKRADRQVVESLNSWRADWHATVERESRETSL